jgi:hypothetical protein
MLQVGDLGPLHFSFRDAGEAALHSYTHLLYIYASAAAHCEPRFPFAWQRQSG